MIKKITKAYLNWHNRNKSLVRMVDIVVFFLYSYLMVCAITQGVWIFFGYIVAFWALSLMAVIFDFIDKYKSNRD